ncbi:MAG: ATP-binding protein [Candidatus Kariarchaeaceae archaeon]|jgi:hypothetical protein
MFVSQIEGTLMELAEAPETRYRYIIWFDYTRQAINKIQEGTLVAVPNFASDSKIRHYSVLEITTILPTHYALQGSSTGYPGFVVEAARSAAQDWESQDTSSTEDTTKIRVVAIPTNLEIVEPLNGDAIVEAESNIPMVGATVNVLDTKYTNLIANNGIDEKYEKNLTIIGQMTRDQDVNILLRVEELFRTHFAIFGFTGVGKSNLLSTVVAKVFNDSSIPVKLVFIDLMSEYTALLLDQLLSDKINGRILTIGRNTLPEGLFRYINELKNAPSLEEATHQLSRYTLLPKALVKNQSLINQGLKELVEKRHIRYFSEAESITVWEFFFTDRITWSKTRQKSKFNQRRNLIIRALRNNGITEFEKTLFRPERCDLIRKAIEHELNQADGSEFKRDGDFANHLTELERIKKTLTTTFSATTTLNDLVTDLNDNNLSSLWIVQAHDPNELRTFCKRFGDALYEKRRQNGLIEPLVSFVYDEADEFIRREKDGTGTYQDSREIAQTLARRGRKFGLGLGIATQRIRYLDTNIMSQPHTYFVSKLPRKSDREAVCEAFGVSEELLNQTFKFKKGDWLLMSHDATGLEAIPIPIHTPDANLRIANWLNECYGSGNGQ